MTVVIAEYELTVNAPDGSVWAARACARPIDDRWEAWIEFIPLGTGQQPVRTPAETTQPDRKAIDDWAEGIRPAYLEGALERAREPLVAVTTEPAPPLFDRPAQTLNAAKPTGAPIPPPILDPYHVYAQGEQLLVDQLAALGTDHLRDSVRAYEMASDETAVHASRAQLVEHILAAVRQQE